MELKTGSVLQMLLGLEPKQKPCNLPAQSNKAVVLPPVSDLDQYIATIMADIDEGRQDICYNPLVVAKPGMQLSATLQQDRCLRQASALTDADVLSMASRPDVFVWIPNKVFPHLRIRCPFCDATVACREWATPKILHGLTKQTVYITVRYRCLDCVADSAKIVLQDAGRPQGQIKKRTERKFQADGAALWQTLRDYVKSCWFVVFRFW